MREIRHRRPITYGKYARVNRGGPRPTILAEGQIGDVRSYKGALKKAHGYIARLKKDELPAPWEEIEGGVLTLHRGHGKAKAVVGGGVIRGPRKTKDTTEWLYYLDKKGNEFAIDRETRKIGTV